MLIMLGGGNPIVPNERVGHHEDLSTIAGVGEALSVASHGGIEDDFTCYGGFVTEGIPLEATSVIED